MRAGKGQELLVAMAISAIAVMIAQPLAIGFASASYTSITACSDNTISSEYFTAGLYSYSGSSTEDIIDYSESQFTPTSNPFNGSLSYSKRGNTYSISSGIVELTDGNVFLVVNSNSTTPRSGFSATHTVSGIGSSCLDSGDSILTWGGGTPSITEGSAYRLSLKLVNVTYSDTARPSSFNISVTITVTDNTHGVYVAPSSIVSFAEVTPVEELENEIEGYNPESGMHFVSDTDNPAGVYIQNSDSDSYHSIADGTGQSAIDVNVTMPPNIYFYIYVTIKAPLFYVQDDHQSHVKVQIYKVGSTGTEDLGYVEIFLSGSSDLARKICIDSATEQLVERASNYNVNNINQCIHCSEGETLRIEFTGMQGKNEVIIFGRDYGTEMTVAAKIVQYYPS